MCGEIMTGIIQLNTLQISVETAFSLVLTLGHDSTELTMDN